ADRARRAAARPTEVAGSDAVSNELSARSGEARSESDPASLVDEASSLETLTDQLPPTERAAVILRYRFDLSYDDIGSALEASSDAARQAASSGVRRLRRTLDAPGARSTTRRDDQ
ncbi:MAG: RNA polymerase sigma factor, partial [Gaiellaceae bacterium]